MMTRSEVIELLAKAASEGHLGLFVGTGFSKDLTQGDDEAPTFRELLERVAKRLDVGEWLNKPENLAGKSPPQIASELEQELEKKLRAEGATNPRTSARRKFRREISAICHLYPDEAQRKRYEAVLSQLKPAWIVTTNYDNIAECVVDGVSVLPHEPFVPHGNRIPIFHFHGDRRRPETLVVSERDYARVQGPTQYRQLKLVLSLAESTTLMLGYSLGDMNVQVARANARAFARKSGARTLARQKHQGKLVHARHMTGTPANDPYSGPSGEIVLEISNIAKLLEEIEAKRSKIDRAQAQSRKRLKRWLENPANAKRLIDDPTARDELMTRVRKAGHRTLPTELLPFFEKALEPVWEKARENGGFEHYAVFLQIPLHFFSQRRLRGMHPRVFAFLANMLNKVGDYIHTEGKHLKGYSFAATDLWMEEREQIPKSVRRELLSYARAQSRPELRTLIASLG